MEDTEVVIIKEIKSATVTYNPEIYTIKVKWRGTISKEDYKVAFESALDFAREGNKVTRFYSDTTESGVVGPENRKFFENEVLPKAIDLGLKRGAVITDANIFKRYYINAILKSINKFNMPFKIVGSETEAIEFLTKE